MTYDYIASSIANPGNWEGAEGLSRAELLAEMRDYCDPGYNWTSRKHRPAILAYREVLAAMVRALRARQASAVFEYGGERIEFTARVAA